MRNVRVCAVATVFAMVAVFAGILSAEEVVVKREEVPQPVLSAIDKLAPGWTLDKAEKQMGKDAADGTLSYEMDVTANGKALRFVLFPDGKLHERWDRKVKLADVSDSVKQGIMKVTNGVEPDAIVKIYPAKGKPYYKFRANKVINSVTMDGELIPADKK